MKKYKKDRMMKIYEILDSKFRKNVLKYIYIWRGVDNMSDKQLILNTVQNIDDTTSYEEILYTLYL